MGRGPTKEFYIDMNDSFVQGSLTCLKPEVIKAEISTDFPLTLNIEPTNACNSNCYYCSRKTTEKLQGVNFLDLELFKQIIDQIPEKQLLMLNLHKDGEPLMNKQLPLMVDYAKKKQVAKTIHLNTNGILLGGKTGHGIIDSGIDDITISVDAAYAETYKKLKGIGAFTKLEQNIHEILNYRNKTNKKTKIRVKIMEFDGVSDEEIQHFREKWTGVADEVQVTGIHSWGGSVKNVNITDEQTNERYPCALLWYTLAVNSNGKVSICNVDWNYSGIVGDIHKNSLNEIWNGKEIRAIRKKHLNGKWEPSSICEECVVWVSVGDVSDYLKTRHDFI